MLSLEKNNKFVHLTFSVYIFIELHVFDIPGGDRLLIS